MEVRETRNGTVRSASLFGGVRWEASNEPQRRPGSIHAAGAEDRERDWSLVRSRRRGIVRMERRRIQNDRSSRREEAQIESRELK